ncbi:MAG: hypothetical protein LBK04_05070 [Clostridiales Family XIII bacterium]|jgi:hypothetical protein|nr:hypothetical protein [Clostridiales Family XIII bacterium]
MNMKYKRGDNARYTNARKYVSIFYRVPCYEEEVIVCEALPRDKYFVYVPGQPGTSFRKRVPARYYKVSGRDLEPVEVADE